MAYVQLRDGASVSEAELMNFAKAEITERAAIPKHIRLIASMPLTGVGKIFKPALKLMEAESAASEALGQAGVSTRAIAARDDKQLGLVVQVSLGKPDDRDNAAAVLGQFSFKSEIVTRP